MYITRAFRALGPVDFRSVQRDSMLKWMVFLPFIVIAAVRIIVPMITEQLWLYLAFDLKPYYALIVSFMFLLMPMFVGMVLGFLLLDQRDDQTITALQVTPISLRGYLIYRITLPVLVSFGVTLVMIPLLGLYSTKWYVLILCALSAAPLAPIFALFYACAAQNKVQGFAVMKASGVILVPPLLAYFIQSNWQWLFVLVPTYVPVKIYWLFTTGSPLAWLVFFIGLAYQSLLIYLLMRLFNRIMHTGQV